MKNFLTGLVAGLVSSSLLLTAVAANKIFHDVPGNAWYATSVASLKDKGIIEGYADGYFRPGSYVNRAEMAVVIDMLIKYIEEGKIVKKSVDKPVVQSGGSLLEKLQKINLVNNYRLDVPFTSQAPDGNWDMPYQEACEEASVIMVKYFWDKGSLNVDVADREIKNLVKWEDDNGMAVDIGVQETAILAEKNYGLQGHVYYDDEVTVDNIKKLLISGHPVILPVAGRLLENPNFTGAGPAYHMIVIVGFDEESFISNDPGTHNGGGYKYSFSTIDKAIHDWAGTKENILEGRRAMLILTED